MRENDILRIEEQLQRNIKRRLTSGILFTFVQILSEIRELGQVRFESRRASQSRRRAELGGEGAGGERARDRTGSHKIAQL